MDNSRFDFLPILRGLAGAVIGGIAGFYTYQWLNSQGWYALALPGVMLGGACGLFSQVRSVPLAIACTILGFFLSLFCEWWFWPFEADESFVYFVTHMYHIDSTVTWILIVLGTLIAGWFGYGRDYSIPTEQPRQES